jgi:hypothetical protein
LPAGGRSGALGLQAVVGYQLASLNSIENGMLVLLEQRGADELVIGSRASLRDHPNTFAMLQAGQPAIIPDLNADTALAGRVRGNVVKAGLQNLYVGINSWMSVPLIARGVPVGVLVLSHPEVNYYTSVRADLALTFANYAAIAIENARQFAAEQRRAEQFRVISEMSYRITSILDVEALVAQTVRLIRETLGYYHVHIGFIEGEVVTFQPTAGLWRDEPVCVCCPPHRLRLGRDGISGHVAASGQPIPNCWMISRLHLSRTTYGRSNVWFADWFSRAHLPCQASPPTRRRNSAIPRIFSCIV